MLSLRIPPPIWLLLAGILMWLLDHFLPVLVVIVTPWNRLGWGVMAIGALPALTAMTQFVRAKTTINPHHPDKTSTLVTDGIYRWTRNPMYLGLLTLLIGWAIRLGSLSPFLIPPAFVLILTQVQILPEERHLRSRFGNDYDRYCKSVGRWLGRHD
jgi:protein-S-isoprenylcysteine O-methyltransferase Ste14